MRESGAKQSGSVVNQVEHEYNDFSPLTAEYQEHGGAVNTSTSPKVEYAHADGSENTVRLEKVTYPDGRELVYHYGTEDEDNDTLSRVQSLDDGDDNPHVAYTYLGLGTFVRSDLPEPEVRWDLITGAGANPYAGLDRFGRTIDCLWHHYGDVPADLDRIKYGYDRASNRIWRQNLVEPTANDELYKYDGLQRLVDMARGTLNDAKDRIDNVAFSQDWNLDATGNWSRFDQLDLLAVQNNLGQQRVSNQVNEITGITERYGKPWVTPVYDRAGNMTTIPGGEPISRLLDYSAYWRLEEASGSRADQSVNGLTLSETGGSVAQATGKIGYGTYYPGGGATERLSRASSSLLSVGTGSFTIAFWGRSDIHDVTALYKDGEYEVAFPGTFGWTARAGDQVCTVNDYNGYVHQWTLVVFTVDRGDNRLRLYINNNAAIVSSGLVASNLTGSADFLVGGKASSQAWKETSTNWSSIPSPSPPPRCRPSTTAAPG